MSERSEVLRIGVFGCGRIGRMHAELLARRVPGASVAAVYDAIPSLATEVGAEVGTRVASSVDDVMGDTGIDAVAICSSTDTHVDLLVRAAEAGKAIFCEKPISLDLDEVTSALDAVAATGVPLQIGFNRRFDPGHRSVRDAVASGELGSLHLVRISSRDPAPPPIEYVAVSGGIFLDMTGHDFDMARFVTGSEVVELYAQGSVNITPEIAQYGDVDTAVVQLRHASDVLTVIDNSRRAVYGYDQRVEAFGAAGLAASDNVPVHGAIIRDAAGAHTAALPYFFIERYEQSYIDGWSSFVTAVQRKRTPEVSGEDGRAALVIGLAARKSLHEHRPVAISEIDLRSTSPLAGA
jgi:myo-inositol 2-dehydrogenase / D-chiro-inositol 1-dehydrogenase